MTWARYDDGWTDRADIAVLTFPARWHLTALIGYCSRTHRYDGVMRAADARRASDVDDPNAAHAELAAAGHLEVTDTGDLRLVRIDDHVPPPSLRDDHRKASSRDRKRRERERRASRPAQDQPDPAAPTPPDPSDADPPVTRVVTRDVTRDTGTGRDGTGQDHQPDTSRVTPTPPWPPVRVIPTLSETRPCYRCDQPTTRPPDDAGFIRCERHARMAGLDDDESAAL